MNIHAPVLIQTANGFTFGVVVSKIITETAQSESTKYEVNVFDRHGETDVSESEISGLEQPSAYDYGMKKAFVAHPGYKWAIAESERRMNPPELPLACESLPASINLPTP